MFRSEIFMKNINNIIGIGYQENHEIYMVLKKKILSRDFTPNELLNLDKLANIMGISRTPLRDALKKLEHEGFLKTIPRKGTFVTGIYRDDLIEIFRFREMVELYAVEMGFSEIIPLVDDMTGVVEQWGQEVKKEDCDGLVLMEQDSKFHGLIVQATNSRIINAYNSLNYQVQTARTYFLQENSRFRDAFNEHLEIVDCIRRENKQETKTALKHHLDNTLVGLIKIIDIVKVF